MQPILAQLLVEPSDLWQLEVDAVSFFFFNYFSVKMELYLRMDFQSQRGENAVNFTPKSFSETTKGYVPNTDAHSLAEHHPPKASTYEPP